MKEKLETFSKYIPIIYPLIIFVGFYNYLSYYRFFDIEIFPYLTVYEILFSIISEITPILIAALLVIFYLMFLIIIPLSKKNGKKKITKENKKTVIDPKFERLQNFRTRQGISTSLIYNNLDELIKYRWNFLIKKFKRKQYSRTFYHFYLLIFNILGFLIKITLWLFFFIFTTGGLLIIFSPLEYDLEYYKPLFTTSKSTILSIFIWSFLIYAMISRANEKNSKNAKRLIQIMPLVFLVFLSITIYQKREAERTLKHLTYDIKFQYENDIIKSSEDVVFVGKTAEYIFLRNIKNQSNFIYPISQVKNLEIKKIIK